MHATALYLSRDQKTYAVPVVSAEVHVRASDQNNTTPDYHVSLVFSLSETLYKCRTKIFKQLHDSFYCTGLSVTCSMSPETSILCALLFFAVCRCDSFSKADESELKRESKIAGIQETEAEWSEKEKFEDVN